MKINGIISFYILYSYELSTTGEIMVVPEGWPSVSIPPFAGAVSTCHGDPAATARLS